MRANWILMSIVCGVAHVCVSIENKTKIEKRNIFGWNLAADTLLSCAFGDVEASIFDVKSETDRAKENSNNDSVEN